MGEWKKISSQYQYKNPWYQIRHDEVLRPDGNPGTYSVVEFYKPGVIILPLENDGLYLIENYRYPVSKYLLEFPLGSIGDERSFLSAAQKELKEETGFKANKWTQLTKFFRFPSITNVYDIFFIAEDLNKGESHLDGNEQIRPPTWYSIQSLIGKIKKEEIVESATMTGIFLAKDYIANNYKLK